MPENGVFAAYWRHEEFLNKFKKFERGGMPPCVWRDRAVVRKIWNLCQILSSGGCTGGECVAWLLLERMYLVMSAVCRCRE